MLILLQKYMRRYQAHCCALLALMVVLICSLFDCHATPLNNVYDTQPLYTVLGSDKFYKAKDMGEIRLYISPLYQQSSTVRDNDGYKVQAGNRLGKWNMFGIFYNPTTPPATVATGRFPLIPSASYTNVNAAQTKVSGITSQVPTVTDTTTDRYRVSADLTDEKNFLTKNVEWYDKYTWAYLKAVRLDYEKIGVRSQLNFDFGFGLGLAIKGGVVDVKNTVEGYDLEDLFSDDALGIKRPETTPSPFTTATADDKIDAPAMYDALFAPRKIKDIAGEFELDLNSYHKTGLEDIHAQIYWHFPIDCYDKAGEVAATVVPYLAAGMWIPAGEKRDFNQLYSVPTGNDGFYGLTAEASIGFDFPVLPEDDSTLQINLGGGFLFLGAKDQVNYRMPTSLYQSGIIPWKTTIHRQPGTTWYMNGSMKAENFLDGLSVYGDFIYTQHLHDEVTIQEASNKDLFNDALSRMVRETAWKNQQVNIGFDYKLAEAIFLGGAVQAHISGVRVYRTVTLLGGVTIIF